jgi:uncharacterized protein (TIGR02453 family)
MKKLIPYDEIEMYPPFDGFPKEGLEFLGRLKKNNNRVWFEKHKSEYENFVKQPMQSLVASLQPHFAQFAPEFDLNPRRSIFRIYRDVRFSPDKTPYKTHIAAHIVLGGKPKGFLGSGYYLHVEPDECYVGGGIYIPDGDQLKKIRKALVSRGNEFLEVVENKKFRRMFAPFNWQKLKRIPKGYDETHPMAEWLKYKQFFVGVTWPGSKCLQVKYVDHVVQTCKELTPLVQFLNSSLV